MILCLRPKRFQIAKTGAGSYPAGMRHKPTDLKDAILIALLREAMQAPLLRAIVQRKMGSIPFSTFSDALDRLQEEGLLSREQATAHTAEEAIERLMDSLGKKVSAKAAALNSKERDQTACRLTLDGERYALLAQIDPHVDSTGRRMLREFRKVLFVKASTPVRINTGPKHARL